MHLSQIEIRNFRNLKSVSASLTTGLNVLVGPNDAGKTNLFDAVRHALGPSASRSEPVWLDQDDVHRDSKDTTALEAIAVTLVFSGLDDDDRAQFFEIVDFQSGVQFQHAPAKINFEAAWNGENRRFRIARWGGDPEGDRSPVPTEIIEALPLVFLPALRDAEEALTPGNRTILARVLSDLARRDKSGHEERFEAIFEAANKELEKETLIQTVERRLRAGAQKMAGVGHSPASIRAAPSHFHRIIRTLRVILEEASVQDISASGVGYSNLLYIAAILSHLEQPIARECPVLLIEEPEAHLSPQLTALLAEYLSQLDVPQVLVNTHSPTFATKVKPSQVHILGERDGTPYCVDLHQAGLSEKEERQLQRMLDITRATLYFARGLILVEGISEALLIPELARLIGVDLARDHISVLPVCGVAFGAFEKLFGSKGMVLPVSIVTDSDPPTVSGGDEGWRGDAPKLGEKCDRLVKLEEIFADSDEVMVFSAEVTLEYDLAAAGEDNPAIIAEVWEETFDGKPRTLNRELVSEATDAKERATCVWRGICRAEHTGSKADFSNLLADWLATQRLAEESKKQDRDERAFAVPDYLQRAIQHVVPSDESPEALNE